MAQDDKIKVAIIDDSAVNRRAISAILKEVPEVEVVCNASDGEEGFKQALFYKPDLITLDLQMPILDGFGFLRLVMAKQPTPVIVVSSDNRKESVFQALELGAVDFVVKPGTRDPEAWKVFADELIAKIVALPGLRVRPQGRVIRALRREERPAGAGHGQVASRLLLIGSSTGGPAALTSIFQQLPYASNTAIMVAQHMPATFTDAFAKRLNSMVPWEVHEGHHGEPLCGGHIYFSPGGWHLVLTRELDGAFVLYLRPPSEKDRYVPSVDVMFESVATMWRHRPLMAMVLTGMGNDGKRGVVAVKKANGIIYAESEQSAVIFGMPKEAWDTGAVTRLLSLDELAQVATQFMIKAEDEGR